MKALLSVTNKTGLVAFAEELCRLGFELVSTGGTAQALRNHGLAVQDVAELTGFPEMLDGRVKTLHPLVHGGLLGDRQSADHCSQMEAAGIEGFDLLVVNLYEFEKTVTAPHTLAEAIESVDIGGPAMIRAASKNFNNVTVVVDPSDYPTVLEHLRDGTVADLRLELMAKAFRHTATYDAMIATYFSRLAPGKPFPTELPIGLKLIAEMRYGENPHQAGAVYANPLSAPGIAQAQQLSGKPLSYNNYLDADAAWELVWDLAPGSCAIIKHGNPCGAASFATPAESFRAARAADTTSAFGGIAAFSAPLDLETAEVVAAKGNFFEVILAPEISPEAVAVFQNRAGWGPDCRLLVVAPPPNTPEMVVRSVRGGLLVQESDEEPETRWQVVTDRAPTAEEWDALHFAWWVTKHVKSNAIVLASGHELVGVGAGQMNRVQSVRLALEQAGTRAGECALASDAFFPFPDSIEVAAAAQVKAVIQPGGSKKDADVIARANELGMTMVLTGYRHFRH